LNKLLDVCSPPFLGVNNIQNGDISEDDKNGRKMTKPECREK